MIIIKWFLNLFKKKKPEPKDKHISFGSFLSKKLDDVYIKHHGELPYQNPDDNDY